MKIVPNELKNTVFFNITEKDGLSSSQVNCILQDSTGFIWIGTENGLNRYDGNSIKVYQNQPDNKTSLPYNRVVSLAQDEEQTIWIGSLSLIAYAPQTEFFTEYIIPRKDTLNSFNPISSIVIDEEGFLWLSWNRGFACFDPKNREFIRTYYFAEIEGKKNVINNVIYQDPKNNDILWLGCEKGMIKFQKSTSSLDWIINQSTENRLRNISSISSDRNGIVYYSGATTTLRMFNQSREKDQYKDFRYSEVDISIPIRSIIVDQSGKKCWIASRKYGFGELDFETGKFNFFSSTKDEFISILSGEVTTLMQDKDNRIWIGLRTGISVLDPQNQIFKLKYQREEGISELHENFLAAAQKQGDSLLYLGTTKNNGLTVIDRNTWEVENYIIAEFDSFEIFDLYFDHENTLWVSSNMGLFIFNTTTNYFKKPSFLKSLADTIRFREIIGDNNKNLYIRTHNPSGILHVNQKTLSIKHFLVGSSDSCGIPNLTQIRGMGVDLDGNLWLGGRPDIVKYEQKDTCFRIIPFRQYTGYIERGAKELTVSKEGKIWIGYGSADITVYNPKDSTIKNIGTFNGIPSNRIYDIVEDHNQKIWISTSVGLAVIDPHSSWKIKSFGLEDGYRQDIFGDVNPTHDVLGTNETFMGAIDNFIIFHPDSIPENTTPPKTVIKSIYIFNKENESEKIIGQKESFKLSYNENTFKITFAALNFTRPKKNIFKYILENYDDQWRTTSIGEAQYTRVKPGSYTFRMKAANNDGIWNDEGTSIKITIFPPWYWNIWSKVLYTLLFLGSLYTFYKFQLHKRLQQAENTRLKELDAIKTRLYTNITHEFRTPLTVIIGMLDKAVKDPKLWLSEGIRMIKRNSLHLLLLVNQMLDLSKLESRSLPVHKVHGDIIFYLKYLIESFQTYAEIREIGLHFISDLNHLEMDYDPDKILSIISNLLSNAIKFTLTKGSIYVQVEKKYHQERSTLQIKVRDTGIGISKEKLPFIFDRFYQVDDTHTRQGEGTGIGLTLTRELIHLLEGKIEVASSIGKGTVFTIVLPIQKTIKKTALISKDQISEKILPFSIGSDNAYDRIFQSQNITENPIVLIIEDNPDVVKFLYTCLNETYQLMSAPNGQLGIEKAIEFVPDIIISDVMMPKKDGYEVCDTLKKEERTSHIPIILLTAKVDITSKIEGLSAGADAYLAKPFNEEELRVRLAKMLELRGNLKEKYQLLQNDISVSKSEMSKEDLWLQKVKKIIEENISNPDFSVLHLSRALAMDRSQVFRKLKALTGKSITRYIRSVRLQQAKYLLLKSDLNISEIAYEVGFKNPAHFSTTFLEEFGDQPNVFRKLARE